MRAMDFHCAAHGFFEAREPFEAPVSTTWPCPKCGVAAAKVYLKAPSIGKINKGVFVVDFPGGHTLTRDDVEERISRKPGVPFESDAGFRDRVAQKVEKVLQMEAAGTLPPARKPTDEQAKVMEKHLAKTGS